MKLFYQLYKEKVFIDYIEEKARELANKENISLFSVSFSELNKDEILENDKAVGIFKYPNRIEITEYGDVFTILHELGHYFLYKRNMTQSEAGANLFIEEFFNTYLPPFFKWIYQIEIKIRGNMDLNFSTLEIEKYIREYKTFKYEKYGTLLCDNWE